MSLGYWLHHPAIRGTVSFLILLLLVAAAWWFATKYWPDAPQPHEPQPIGTEAEYVSKNLDKDCQALLAAPPIPDPTPSQTDNCSDKATAQKYNFAGLAQSIRSANAAVYAAYIGYLQTCIGIIGAILVTATLSASGLATWAAYNAARGTIDAAAATRDAVELSRRQIALVHRPKLRVRNVVVLPTAEGAPIKIEAEIANVGDNSATAYYIRYRLEQRTPSGHVMHHGGGTTEHIGDAGEVRPVLYPVAAGASIVVRIETDLPWEAAAFAKLSDWVVVGDVLYRDTYIGDRFDFTAKARHESTERRTSFERFFRRKTTSGYIRFRRAENPDPESEYED